MDAEKLHRIDPLRALSDRSISDKSSCSHRLGPAAMKGGSQPSGGVTLSRRLPQQRTRSGLKEISGLKLASRPLGTRRLQFLQGAGRHAARRLGNSDALIEKRLHVLAQQLGLHLQYLGESSRPQQRLTRLGGMPHDLLGVARPGRRDLLRALGNGRARPLGGVSGGCRSVGCLPYPLLAEFGKAFGLLGGLAASSPISVVRSVATVLLD